MNKLVLLLLISTLPFSSAAVAARHHCFGDAAVRAEKLLSLHSEGDDRASIDETPVLLAPIRNPSDKTQKFDVIELIGHVYKANFRIHMIYAQFPDTCILVGQEILELTTL